MQVDKSDKPLHEVKIVKATVSSEGPNKHFS